LDRRTQDHLARARRNRDVADALTNPATRGIINPPAFEWAVVAAFYSAVHYVNAYLWEKLRHEPSNHEGRANMVNRVSDLRSAARSYRRLQSLAYQARYAPEFSISPSDAVDAVQTDLRAIERAVVSALDA
jgi:HEPN domain